MNISNLTFPLTVDFSGGKYWLNGEGPYQCGEAATAFLAGEIDCEPAGDPSRLTQELETVLKTFGSYLFPCAEEQETVCERTAPGETEKTCREIGARACIHRISSSICTEF